MFQVRRQHIHTIADEKYSVTQYCLGKWFYHRILVVMIAEASYQWDSPYNSCCCEFLIETPFDLMMRWITLAT